MCRNHSHLVVDWIGVIELEGLSHEAWTVLQELTLELPDGRKYTRPVGSIFLIPFLRPEDLQASRLLAMAVQLGFMPVVEPGQPPDTGTPQSKSNTH